MKCVASFVHQAFNVGYVCLGHTIRTPAVQRNQYYMFCLPFSRPSHIAESDRKQTYKTNNFFMVFYLYLILSFVYLLFFNEIGRIGYLLYDPFLQAYPRTETICIFIQLNHSRTICKVIIYCVATRIASVCQQDSLP